MAQMEQVYAESAKKTLCSLKPVQESHGNLSQSLKSLRAYNEQIYAQHSRLGYLPFLFFLLCLIFISKTKTKEKKRKEKKKKKPKKLELFKLISALNWGNFAKNFVRMLQISFKKFKPLKITCGGFEKRFYGE